MEVTIMSKYRLTDYHLSKIFLIVGFNIFIALLSYDEGISQQTCNGTPDVNKWILTSSVEAGDPVGVSISVVGCTGEVNTLIPFSGALLIDMSLSMDDSDSNDKRFDAAIDFVNCVSSGTELALIYFRDEATLRQQLTTDQDDLIGNINWLRNQANSGGTNMYDAMLLGQEELINTNSQGEKFIILLADGGDTSNHSPSDFENLLMQAQSHNIRYYNIFLSTGPGNIPGYTALELIAERTDGESYLGTDPSQLSQLYLEICDIAGRLVSTRDIVLYEKLNSNVEIIPGTIWSDIESISQGDFDLFESSGEITADIGKLESSEGRSIGFEVNSHCLSPDSDEESIEVNVDDGSSIVTYNFGPYSGEVEVPLRTFECYKPGNLRVEKDYDLQTSVLSISLQNMYSAIPGKDNTIRNIRVIDNPSIYFQPRLSSAAPPIQTVFADALTDWLLWEIHELDPKETKTLKINLESRVCSNYRYSPPIDVNAGKNTGGGPGHIHYTRPDGTSDIIIMPFERTSLPMVETCDGRADIWIEAAYTYYEYMYSPEIDPYSALPKHESPHIWVDSEEELGFWDWSSESVGDFIIGASATSTDTGIPIERRIRVLRQGDVFSAISNNKIMVRIRNTGSELSEVLSTGARLLVFNHNHAVPSAWHLIGTEALPQINPQDSELISFLIAPNTLRPEHIRPYALTVEDAMQIISVLSPMVAANIRIWANSHTSEWSSLESQGKILPGDLLNVLNGRPKVFFRNFLNSFGDTIAWGKPYAIVKVVVDEVTSEKHTNNNLSTEIIIVNCEGK
jgi:hypothetical protein